MKLNIALIQMDIQFGNPQVNFERATEKIREAAQQDVDLVMLPELWTTGYDLKRLEDIADENGEALQSFIKTLAETYHVNIIAGSVAKRSTGGGVTNTLYAFDRSGQVVGEYNKAHLFRLMEEEKYLQPGSNDGIFEIEGVKSAGLICYDLRFPEWIRRHVLQGAKVLYIPAEWPKPRTDHWRTLLIARAIENQCFVVACNRIGSDPNNEFGGHSIIINPWGEIIAEADDQETILYGTIDLEEVEEIRSRIPIFEDRREGLY
jgi:omega-amidase